MKVGGIVLCGGKSKRMGLPKATLPFGPELMIERVLRLLGEVVEPLVVVAAPRQELPRVSENIIITHDKREDCGPLEGLYAGLSAIQPYAGTAYVTSCDVPLLKQAFVRRMIDSLGEHDVAVPVDDSFHHPLAAVYRTTVLPYIKKLLNADRMRPLFLFNEVNTNRVLVDSLKDVDSELRTLANLNRPDDYFAALKHEGFEVPTEILDRLPNS